MENKVFTDISITVKGEVIEVKNKNMKDTISFAYFNNVYAAPIRLDHPENIFVRADGHILFTISSPAMVRYIRQSIDEGSIGNE